MKCLFFCSYNRPLSKFWAHGICFVMQLTEVEARLSERHNGTYSQRLFIAICDNALDKDMNLEQLVKFGDIVDACLEDREQRPVAKKVSRVTWSAHLLAWCWVPYLNSVCLRSLEYRSKLWRMYRNSQTHFIAVCNTGTCYRNLWPMKSDPPHQGQCRKLTVCS